MPTATDHGLRDARRRAHISQDELAARLHVDRSVVSRAERGYVQLSPELHARAMQICTHVAVVERAVGA